MRIISKFIFFFSQTFNKFYIKNQSWFCRDYRWTSSNSVGHVVWASEGSFFAFFHHGEAFVPAFDDLSSAQIEFKWCSAWLKTWVKNFSIEELSSIVAPNFLACMTHGTDAFLGCFLFEWDERVSSGSNISGWHSCWSSENQMEKWLEIWLKKAEKWNDHFWKSWNGKHIFYEI